MQGSRAKAEVIAMLEERKLVFVQHGPGRKNFVVDRAVRTSASDILGIVAKGSRGKIIGDNVMMSKEISRILIQGKSEVKASDMGQKGIERGGEGNFLVKGKYRNCFHSLLKCSLKPACRVLIYGYKCFVEFLDQISKGVGVEDRKSTRLNSSHT